MSIKRVIVLSCSLAFLFACERPKMVVDNVTIQIKEYDESDRGRMWKVCIESDHKTSEPWIDYIITFNNGYFLEAGEQYDFYRCKEFNSLVYLTHRHTKHYLWELLRDAEADSLNMFV